MVPGDVCPPLPVLASTSVMMTFSHRERQDSQKHTSAGICLPLLLELIFLHGPISHISTQNQTSEPLTTCPAA